MLEKKQVISFLKILQIPTNQTPEEIELSLKKAGWNPQDAKEAVAILHPEEEGEKKVIKRPQIVAQMSKPSAVPQAPEETEETEVSTAVPGQTSEEQSVPPPVSPTPTETEDTEPAQAAPTPASSASGDVIDPSMTPPPKGPVAPPPAAPKATGKEKSKTPAKQAKKTPVSFTPTHIPHQEGVAIVHESPVSHDAMAQQMFRTDDRLTAETISGLLGIDIDVSQDDIIVQRNRRQPGITFVQLMVILVSSITLAFAALLYGMYLFEVGPFHPTVDAFKAFSFR